MSYTPRSKQEKKGKAPAFVAKAKGMIDCPWCGKPNPAGATRCATCGRPLPKK